MLDDVFAGSQWLKITHNVSLDLSKNIFQCKKKNILKSHNKLVTKMKRYFFWWFSNTVPDWLHEIVPSRNRWQWCGSSWWAMHAPTSFSVWDWHPRGVCPVILAPRTTVKGHGMAAKLPSSSTHSLAPLASKGSTDQRLFEACKSWFRYNCGCVGSSSHQHWFLRRWFLRMWPNWTFLRLRQRANYYKGWSTLVPIVFKIIVKWCLKHQISYNLEAFFTIFFMTSFGGSGASTICLFVKGF